MYIKLHLALIILILSIKKYFKKLKRILIENS